MGFSVLERPRPRLALFAPPYEEFRDIDVGWAPPALPLRGLAVVWWLADGRAQEEEFQWLHERAPALPLFIVLPPARHLTDALPLLNYVHALSPRAVLPTGNVVSPEYIRTMLAAPPPNLATAVANHLSARRLLRADVVGREIKRVLELAPETASISGLSRRLYTSRRTLGRHFYAAGLPVPCHWLQFARLVHVSVRLQNETASVFRVVSGAGYPDGFTLSNQMKRLLDCRPSEVRRLLGWEWIVESWICQEARNGGFDLDRHGDALALYVRGEGKGGGEREEG